MKMRITDTTDGQFLGRVFDSDENPIILGVDVKIYIDRNISLSDGVRYVSSNYIIDTIRGEQ